MSFDRAWRAFVKEEAALRAPVSLETRVRSAIADRVTPQKRSQRAASIVVALPVAAAITVMVWWPPATAPLQQPAPGAIAARPLADQAPLVPYRASVSARVMPPSESRNPQPATITARLTTTPTRSSIEPLQVVRLRVPREALESLGLVLLDPETPAIVDVDVLIGEDGLPLDIRHVRTEQEQ